MLILKTRGLQTLTQILRHSTSTGTITTKATGHLMAGAVAITREKLKLNHPITMAIIIITRAMEATLGCHIEASMAMARGMQSLTQNLRHSIITVITSNHMEDMASPIGATMDMVRGMLRLKQMRVTTRERRRLILRHSTTMDTTPRAMVEVIIAIMAMARGLLNPKLMQRLILRPSIIMAIIPRVTGEVTVIIITITFQAMGMVKGMLRQKLKPSNPITMDITLSLALVFRRAMVFKKVLALVFRRGLAFKRAMVSRRAMVFRRAMVLHMGVLRRVMALIMVATTKDLLRLRRSLFINMVMADMGITNPGAMGMDTRVEVSARRNFTITTNEVQRIPAPTWSVER